MLAAQAATLASARQAMQLMVTLLEHSEAGAQAQATSLGQINSAAAQPVVQETLGDILAELRMQAVAQSASGPPAAHDEVRAVTG